MLAAAEKVRQEAGEVSALGFKVSQQKHQYVSWQIILLLAH
jgi:hypothetical protein